MPKTAHEIVTAIPQLSARPEFYLGRGNSPSDLNSALIERVYQGIKTEHGDKAAKAFVQMVADLTPDASATTFLHALYMLEEAGWHYSKAIAPDGDKALGESLAIMVEGGDRFIPKLALADRLKAPLGTTAFLKVTGEVSAALITGEFLRAHADELDKPAASNDEPAGSHAVSLRRRNTRGQSPRFD